MRHHTIVSIASMAVVLALCVILLGAYTRLTDAGLGCPDWPGCYGRLVLPQAQQHLAQVQKQYPTIPLEAGKAWTEMIHRYAAGTLAILIFTLSIALIIQRFQGKKVPWCIPVCLLALVIFQAALGMWTVTLKLLPIVVMSHLLGGIFIFALLSRLRVQLNSNYGQQLPQWRWFIRIGLIILFLQIALGGWVSSNYAGVACLGFPTCNGQWFPHLHFMEGFNLWYPVVANYQGGVLDSQARMSIQWVHRIVAFVTFGYWFILSLALMTRVRNQVVKYTVIFILCLLVLQISLGILNVLYFLPLSLAVAHNGVAALLMATTFCLLQLTYKEDAYAW